MIEEVKKVKFYNGVEMPIVGFGTAFLPKDRMDSIINCAVEAGYRRFDTASKYDNEKELGSIFKNLAIPREELFISTKLNRKNLYFNSYRSGRGRFLNIRNFRSIATEIETSFKNLQVDYIDLMTIHWPWSNSVQLWEGLEKFYHAGRIKAIGVCSFLPPHINYLLERVEVTPMLNQFEISPLNTQKELIDFCNEKEIQVEAMSTFSHFRSNEPRLEILQNPRLEEMAAIYNKTVAQIVNRWLIQQGISIVPKSKSEIHIKENIDLFDFELSKEDMAVIDSMDQGEFLNHRPVYEWRWMPKKYRDFHWFK